METAETKKQPLFRGCGTALVTPMKKPTAAGDGYVPPAVDYEAFARLVRAQLAAGVDALIVAGTTGESPTLTDAEKESLIRLAVAERNAARAAGVIRDSVPVIAGSGSNNTARAIEISRLAERAGADGLLVVTPYYNKTNQKGLIAHFTAVADAVTLPVILYHVPGRTGCRMTPETCLALSRHPRIAGLKDASGDVSFAARTAALCGDALPLYSGNDDMTLPLLSLGAVGVISVVSNLYPAETAGLCRAFFAGDLAGARRLHERLLPVCDALFSDINPIPVKGAMEIMGVCKGELRLPLMKADAKTNEIIKTIMQQQN